VSVERAIDRGLAGLAAILVALLLTGGLSSCAMHGGTPSADSDVPVATVQRTDLNVEVNTTGDLRSTQTAELSAPPIAGGTLQIIHLVKTGSLIKTGDVIVEFDPSEQEYNLAQNRSDFEQAEQEIVKAKDDASVQEAEDKTALLKAKFAVRQAELDVSKSEILSAIDAKKNQLTLDEAKRALAQLELDIQSHTASNQATIAVDDEKRNKAGLAMKQAQQNIDDMRVKSTIDGLVVLRPNRDASGGFFFGGMNLPDYQEGDQVNPGNIVAEVIDVNQMEIAAKVIEKERENVKTGQTVDIHIDALPGKVFQGKVKNVAGMVSTSFFDDDDPVHKFDVTIQFDHADGSLRPGFGAHLDVLGDHLQHALSIPRQAVFEKDGKPSVFVKTGNTFEQREIKIQNVTGGLAVIDGLKEGAQVALINPEKKTSGPAKPNDAAPPSFGGGTP
jgi:HlyD family secretion protein